MFKPTPSLQKTLRRLPLSTKQAGKEYYKGNRVGSMGTIDRYGNFRADWSKIRTFVYPLYGTADSELTPFVAETVEKVKTVGDGHRPYDKRFTAEDYLREWKLLGGYDSVDTESVTTSNRSMPEPFEEKAGKKA